MKLGKKESPEMLDAFNFYLSLGTSRTIQRVADGWKKKSYSWVKEVAARWKWSDRADAIDRKAAEHAIELTKEGLMKAKARKLRIIQAIDGRIAQALNANKLKITAADFERVARLEMLLRGEADSRLGVEKDSLATLIKRNHERRAHESD
jgi:hypothetical protein